MRIESILNQLNPIWIMAWILSEFYQLAYPCKENVHVKKLVKILENKEVYLGTGFFWHVLWFIQNKTGQNTYKFEWLNNHK